MPGPTLKNNVNTKNTVFPVNLKFVYQKLIFDPGFHL